MNSSLSNFKLVKTSLQLGDTPAMKYEWLDYRNALVGKFTVFEWWDGLNIENLEVANEYRNKKLSYQLLDYATSVLGCVSLSVELDNVIAKYIYAKYGFVVVYQDDKRYYMSIKNLKL